jgi:hypothetical protein
LRSDQCFFTRTSLKNPENQEVNEAKHRWIATAELRELRRCEQVLNVVDVRVITEIRKCLKVCAIEFAGAREKVGDQADPSQSECPTALAWMIQHQAKKQGEPSAGRSSKPRCLALTRSSPSLFDQHGWRRSSREVDP